MEEHYLNYDWSLALRHLGFHELCIRGYYKGEVIYSSADKPWDFNKKQPEEGHFVSSPTWEQVIDWFIIHHSLEGQIKSWTERGEIVWYISVEPVGTPSRFKPYEFIGTTPQEAKVACLQKLIEIVKTKE